MDVELVNIHKTFGKVHANNGISLTVKSGTVQGILGENGAGKSTLMKILSGFIQADSGDILLDGKKVTIHSPADSVKLGIGMLHQDPQDFPPMKVIDNLIIGSPVGLFPNRKKILKEFTALQKQFNFSISADTYVDTLTVGERQQLEILRLLWLGAEVLILDEPTTGISASQKDLLFATIRKLASQGKAILFVSHKLDEVESLCSQVVVFRQGLNVGSMKPPFATDKLVEMMFGKSIVRSENVCDKQEDTNFEIQDLAIDDVRLTIRDVNFCIQKGEVIGLAGMEGSGQALILRALAGIIRPIGGHIFMNVDSGNKNIDLVGKHYFNYRKKGIHFLPAARLEEGLIPGLSLADHFALSEEQTGFMVDRDQIVDLSEKRITDFNIRGTPESRIEELSGGNQQRAELALMRNPLRLLLLEHPTRGLDIESSMYIWGKLKQRCTEGASIIFISSDLDEVIHYSDRILVFFGGKVSPAIDATTVTIDQLGQLIGGKGWS
ncbi:MAG: ATP-binding cassette domain-containing protein [Anaerolineaceae bacterium]|jgi:simple sugar transport system ATP-binding protein